jgi:hypothetical protein
MEWHLTLPSFTSTWPESDSTKVVMLKILAIWHPERTFTKVGSSFLNDFYTRPWKGLFLVSLFFGKYKVDTSTWKEGSLVNEGLSD